MNSKKQAKLILDISIAEQLPSILLDTGADPGLILTEKFWSKISSGLHLLQEKKSKLATPYGYLPCREINVKELIRELEKVKGVVKEEGVIQDQLKDDNLTNQIDSFLPCTHLFGRILRNSFQYSFLDTILTRTRRKNR